MIIIRRENRNNKSWRFIKLSENQIIRKILKKQQSSCKRLGKKINKSDKKKK